MHPFFSPLGRVLAASLLLVGAHRRAFRQGRTLVLHDAPAPVARVLRLTRLDRVLRQTRSTTAVA